MPVSESQIRSSLAGVSNEPFWLDSSERPEAADSLSGNRSCDLAVVGGGFTGLWTALLAKERDPDRHVVLLEGGTIGWAASGRNGGFCEASLTHGWDNGEKHLPNENAQLTRLGYRNLDEIEETIARYGIDCDFERTGLIDIATEDYQVAELKKAHNPAEDAVFLTKGELQASIKSPTYKGGLFMERECAVLNPAKLCWGLLRVCRDLGVEVYENSVVRNLENAGNTVKLTTDHGTVTARRVALGTNAFPALLNRVKWHTAPIYDYALMTEPLSDKQWSEIGWSGREGLADAANQFHYYRRTVDGRILFGGWDAVYYYGRAVSPKLYTRQETFDTLARHFFETFPQAEGTKFTHAWGGAIDASTRFFAFFDTAYRGKVAYTAGFTGLGVGASRFGADVMLDLLEGAKTEITELEMVKKKPLPFPPEPFMWVGAKLTTKALIKSDQNEGKRGPLLRVLDAMGVGFAS